MVEASHHAELQALQMARYNQWMNQRLYALCGTLSEAERQQDRGAFFQSIHLTLNHIYYGDLAFLSRFTGDPAAVPDLGAVLFADFASLATARAALDVRIIGWVQSLPLSWFGQELTFTSNVDRVSRTQPHWLVLTHMFNHQTHHRGQITTLLNQLGHDMGTTDLTFMPAEQHLT